MSVSQTEIAGTSGDFVFRPSDIFSGGAPTCLHVPSTTYTGFSSCCFDDIVEACASYEYTDQVCIVSPFNASFSAENNWDGSDAACCSAYATTFDTNLLQACDEQIES